MDGKKGLSPARLRALGSEFSFSALWWALIRFGFRLLYHELAFTYDPVSWIVSLGQWRDWQRAALIHVAAPPGAPILELAHGTGNFQIDLRRAGYRVAALDLSPAMSRLAIRRLRRWGYRPPLVRARAQALPFSAGQFAAVVSTFPTEFIVDPATLAEVFRVLKPGGRLVVVFGGLLTGHSPPAQALEFAYRVTGQRGPWPTHVEATLAEAGFTAEIITEELQRSTVLLFVGEKTTLPNS